MFLMQLGEILPGGVGSGIAIMVVMALLSVFVAGLMVGRTPEYLGKKIEAREIQCRHDRGADPAARHPGLHRRVRHLPEGARAC
jgi:hypothetical protein